MREITAVILEGIKATNNLSVKLVAGKSIRDYLFGLRDNFKNCFSQRLKRGSVRLRNLR
jgi:hypothetical protein